MKMPELIRVGEHAGSSVPDIFHVWNDEGWDNLRMVTQLCQRDIDENGLSIQIQATLDRREAFKDAKYVINCVRVGMLEAFATDVEEKAKYRALASAAAEENVK